MADTALAETAALIVAAGRGQRAGGGVAKQWRPLLGRPMVEWTLEAATASNAIDNVVVVVPRGEADRVPANGTVRVVEGADTRASSVRAGLEALDDTGVTRVLIHDAARPCATPDLFQRVTRALDGHAAAAPGLPMTDALWRGAAAVEGTVSRSGLYRAQTPQGFHFRDILEAHRGHDGTAADDVEVARLAGLDVAIVMGEEENLKVTVEDDFARAESILAARGGGVLTDIRTGNGFDVHAFGPGNAVTLCGIPVPHDKGLVGHSDADVGLHTITDAIYGALARGDIGFHFPPSDPQWKGTDSAVFLAHAAGLARDEGYRITHIDCTLICETPKIGPHVPEMTARVAQICGVEQSRVSVKATTSERLGFTGRGEGIAAMATATLVRP